MLGVLRAIGALVLLSALSTACSQNGSAAGKAPGGPDVPPEGGVSDAVDLGLPEPTDGFQILSRGAEIAPGEEREYCEVGRLPGGADDVYYVSFIELANGSGSHHLGLGVAEVGSPSEAKLIELGEGNRVECPGPRIAFGDGLEVIATIQVPHGQATLPAGVARKYSGGQYIAFDYHYANLGVTPILARSAVNFHLIAADTVEHVAQTFGLNNLMLDTPPGQTASFTGECHFDADVMIGALTRHTHHWGKDFSVWYAGGPRDGEEIWTSHDWQHETEFVFDEPALVRAGDGLRYRCTYENDTARPLRFGTSVNDEMCMLYGPAWSPDDEHIALKGCGIAWVDDTGIGHPPNEAGGFPKPRAADTNLCMLPFGPSIDDCTRCRCESCATSIIKCAVDADCNALLSCYASCSDGACIRDCDPLLSEHSSGQGLFSQAIACSYAQCSVCGSLGDLGI